MTNFTHILGGAYKVYIQVHFRMAEFMPPDGDKLE